jgi:GH24 family phage-related lysozyme (muramidase)
MNRIGVSALTFSLTAFAGLAGHEYYASQAMIPVKGDRPTVGFGSTFRDDGTPVQLGDTITPVQAILRSAKHIAKDETQLKACITAPLFQWEYDTLVDHAYQYGAVTTCNSSVVRLTNQGKYAEACQAYLNFKYMTASQPYKGWEPFRFDAAGKPTRWRYDCTTPGNKICAGVGKRSQERVKSCMGGQ